MHVRSSGDPVEITGERDSLAISCDLSEFHSCNHTHIGYAHEYVQYSVEDSLIRCRDCAEEAGCLDTENWHMYLLIFV
jgi:hypothetical protein